MVHHHGPRTPGTRIQCPTRLPFKVSGTGTGQHNCKTWSQETTGEDRKSVCRGGTSRKGLRPVTVATKKAVRGKEEEGESTLVSGEEEGTYLCTGRREHKSLCVSRRPGGKPSNTVFVSTRTSRQTPLGSLLPVVSRWLGGGVSFTDEKRE